MTDIVRTLAKIAGDGGVLTGTDVSSRSAGIWRSDTIKAKAIVRPRNTEEVSAILEACNMPLPFPRSIFRPNSNGR